MSGRPQTDFGERFEALYTPVPEAGCWLWTGAIMKNGYGKMFKDGGYVTAHRASWKVHFGEIPNGLFVCHKCDVRSCVNPNHLYLGTHQDNMQDMVRKGRHAKSGAKLSRPDVERIRILHATGYITQEELGKAFDVSQGNIGQIISGNTWKH